MLCLAIGFPLLRAEAIEFLDDLGKFFWQREGRN
jgi:hypothetical protein